MSINMGMDGRALVVGVDDACVSHELGVVCCRSAAHDGAPISLPLAEDAHA